MRGNQHEQRIAEQRCRYDDEESLRYVGRFSAIRSTPPGCACFRLTAKPAFAEGRVDFGFVVILVARHMVDAFARIELDVAFDIAGNCRLPRRNWCRGRGDYRQLGRRIVNQLRRNPHVDAVTEYVRVLEDIPCSGAVAPADRDARTLRRRTDDGVVRAWACAKVRVAVGIRTSDVRRVVWRYRRSQIVFNAIR